MTVSNLTDSIHVTWSLTKHLKKRKKIFVQYDLSSYSVQIGLLFTFYLHICMKKQTHANFGYLATNPFEAPPPNAAMNCWHGQLGLMYNLEAWKIKKKEQKVNSINTKSRWTIVFFADGWRNINTKHRYRKSYTYF